MVGGGAALFGVEGCTSCEKRQAAPSRHMPLAKNVHGGRLSAGADAGGGGPVGIGGAGRAGGAGHAGGGPDGSGGAGGGPDGSGGANGCCPIIVCLGTGAIKAGIG